MKSQEDLNALKNEVESLSNKLAELTEEELAEVNGGSGGDETRKIGGYNFSGHVPAEDVVLGRDYYFTMDGKDQWYRGTVIEIREESYYIFFSKRVFLLRLSDVNGYGAAGTCLIDSTDATAYTNMIRTWY